jgi:hypothetical protein
MKPADVSFDRRSTKLRISSGAPTNKVNGLQDNLAALAAVISGRFAGSKSVNMNAHRTMFEFLL